MTVLRLDGIHSIYEWITASLARRMMAGLAAILTVASLCFLSFFILSYRGRMLEERTNASMELNRFLQIGLENAMLKRDLPGLRQMVDRLARESNVARVLILAPDGEVRFASDGRLLGTVVDIAAGDLCSACRQNPEPGRSYAAYLTGTDTGDVLRSINPVRNHEPCTTCHGTVAAHPVNGILVVDYDATGLRNDTVRATVLLAGSGFLVMLASLTGIGWLLSRTVVAPVGHLREATVAISLGHLDRRVPDEGRDEIAGLGRSFNAMARRIGDGIACIEQRERFLQSLIDAIPDGVRVIDADYRVVNANAAFLAQTGLPIEGVVGRPCHLSSHRRDQPCPATLVTCPMHELARDPSPLSCRHRHVRNDGGELNVEVNAALCRGAGPGGSDLVVEVIRDLSQDMRVSQEQRLSEIGYLAAGVAHEIHNPLASIQFGLASVGQALEEGRPQGASEYMRVIEQQIGRCIDVTARLLKLSAHPGDDPELITIADVVADTVSLLSAEALNAGVTIETSLEPGLRVIGSDPDLRMLVLNLAQNAIHAMPAGGRLTVGSSASDDTIHLAIADTGVGIPAAEIPRIFEPFWSRRADGIQGTGLGLPICREIVRNAKGTIAVDSTPGRGTVFTVTFPSADAAPSCPAGSSRVADDAASPPPAIPDGQ